MCALHLQALDLHRETWDTQEVLAGGIKGPWGNAKTSVCFIKHTYTLSWEIPLASPSKAAHVAIQFWLKKTTQLVL